MQPLDYPSQAKATVLPHDFGWAQFSFWTAVQDQQARTSPLLVIEEIPTGPAADPHVQAWSSTVPLQLETV